MSSGLKYGIIAGAGVILYLFVFYFIDPRWMLNAGVQMSSLLVYIVCMILCGRTLVRQHEEAEQRFILRNVFTTFLVANILYYAFYFVMFNYVNTGLVALQKEVMIGFYQWFAPEEQRDAIVKNLEQTDFTVGFRTVIFSYAKGAIGGFVLAVIVAYFAKRI